MRSCLENGLTTTKPSQQSPIFMAPHHPGPALDPLPQRILMETPPHLLAWTQPKWLKVHMHYEEGKGREGRLI